MVSKLSLMDEDRNYYLWPGIIHTLVPSSGQKRKYNNEVADLKSKWILVDWWAFFYIFLLLNNRSAWLGEECVTAYDTLFIYTFLRVSGEGSNYVIL